MAQVSNQDLDQIILQGKAGTLVRVAKGLGETLGEQELGRTQIRSIYGTVREIKAAKTFGTAEQYQFRLLLPKLEYAVAREPKLGPLRDALAGAIERVLQDEPQSAERFDRFMDFFEAIVAYHYAASKKKS